MDFDPAFRTRILIPLNITAYQLAWAQELKFPAGWQQTGVVTADQSVIDRETASGLAKIVVSEDCDWGIVSRKDDTSVIAIRGTETQHQWLEDYRAIAQPVPHGAGGCIKALTMCGIRSPEFAESLGHGVFRPTRRSILRGTVWVRRWR